MDNLPPVAFANSAATSPHRVTPLLRVIQVFANTVPDTGSRVSELICRLLAEESDIPAPPDRFQRRRKDQLKTVSMRLFLMSFSRGGVEHRDDGV